MLRDIDLRKLHARATVYRVADSQGLCIEVTPQGSKLWRYRYRFNGTPKMIALGDGYPRTSLAKARELRDEQRAVLRSGVDPAAQRRAEKAPAVVVKPATFEEVAQAWLDRRQGKGGRVIADVTYAKNRWLLETYAFPAIGSRPIREITSRELLDMLREAESAGKLETAARLKIKVGQIFRYAILEGSADTDPSAALRGVLRAPAAKNHASPKQPAEIGALMRAIDGLQGQPVTVAALKLAPLVFVRPGELRGARWSEFDLDGKEWRIPADRMKMKSPHIVPLSTQAVAILKELKPLTGSGELVFPGVRSSKSPMSENTLNAALRRLGYTTDEATAHGFRSMASTRLNELGWAPDVIERQLAHVEQNSVRAAYNHAQYIDERRRMMQAWADYLDKLRTDVAR